jgi:hypothetical protein
MNGFSQITCLPAHAGNDHLRVGCGRRADIDDVDGVVGQQSAIVALGLRDAEAPGEIDDVIAARHGVSRRDVAPSRP